MYHIADDLLTQQQIDFKLLTPLIKETANKVITNRPKEVQTGPAKRNDEEVVKNHIKMLANSPSYHDIYQLITKHILKDL